MASQRDKPLMRNLGEFVGHIVRGFRANPRKQIVRKESREEDRGGVVLRRTTIEEIEFRDERK